MLSFSFFLVFLIVFFGAPVFWILLGFVSFLGILTNTSFVACSVRGFVFRKTTQAIFLLVVDVYLDFQETGPALRSAKFEFVFTVSLFSYKCVQVEWLRKSLV